jgi:hypothetical protein
MLKKQLHQRSRVDIHSLPLMMSARLAISFPLFCELPNSNDYGQHFLLRQLLLCSRILEAA